MYTLYSSSATRISLHLLVHLLTDLEIRDYVDLKRNESVAVKFICLLKFKQEKSSDI